MRPSWSRHKLGAVGLATLIVLVVAALQIKRVHATMPYPQHIDEGTLMLSAEHVLKSGSWNPDLYAYPPLSVYMITAGLSVGVISASGHEPGWVTMETLGRLIAPYYDRPRVAAVPRMMWAMMSVVSIAAMSTVALRLGGPLLLALVALVQLFGVSLLAMGSRYLNVDTPLAMFSALCFAQLFSTLGDKRARHRIWLPALLIGAATASKYTGCLLLLPCVLRIWLYADRDRFVDSLALVFGSFVAFVICCPYFVLDLPHYVEGIAFENYHYRLRGHGSFTIEPGLPQLLAYGADTLREYGYGLCAMAVLGILAVLSTDLRRSALLLSFAGGWILFLCQYKVHFARNLLPFFLLVPVFAGMGMLFGWQLLAAGVRRLRWPRVIARATALAAIAVALLIAPTLPLGRTIQYARAESEARVMLVRWAAKNLEPGSKIYVPLTLPFDFHTVSDPLRALPLDLEKPAEVDALAAGDYLVVPRWTTFAGRVLDYDFVRHFERREVIPAKDDDIYMDPGFDLVRMRAKPRSGAGEKSSTLASP
jgi:hypothetical protein